MFPEINVNQNKNNQKNLSLNQFVRKIHRFKFT